MIKSEELMLGNWVTDRGNKLLIIDWFERDKVCMKQSVGGVEVHPMTEYFDFLQPIPLTEELLLKCKGFAKDDYFDGRFDYANDDILITVDIINGEIGIDLQWFGIKCKYLHQLQNLYFCLTGKHLEIEL